MTDPTSQPVSGSAEPTAGAAAPAATAGSGPRPLGRQVKLAMAALAVVALVALFWPRGDGSFQAPGGFLVDASGRPQPMGPRLEPVTLVHFWATWCPPCITEIPALDRLRQDLAAQPDFTVLMVAVGDEVAKVETFLGDRRGSVLFDPDWDVAHRYGTLQLPESYLVVHGRVVKKWVGEVDWDAPAVRERIRRALAGTAES